MQMMNWLIIFFIVVSEANLAAQSASPSQAPTDTPVTLSDFVRNLPAYVQTDDSKVLENATVAERDSEIPKLMQWIEDERPQVRGSAILDLSFLYMPSTKRPGSPYTETLPVQYMPAVAAHLRDPDSTVRNATFYTLFATTLNRANSDALTQLVTPLLRETDALTQYPDPFFIKARKFMLEGMTSEQRARFEAIPYKVIYLPAEGTRWIGLLTTRTQQPSVAVDDALIAFLDRKDQTTSTLQECLHTLEVSFASERVNDEALRRIFEQKAMTVFLLQFVAHLRLTPAQVIVQKERLVSLSNDESAHPALRRSARTVAACWNEQRAGSCKPDDKDLSEQLDTK